MQAAPSYTAVSARQSLQRPNVTASPPKTRKMQWSEDVRLYVQRALDPESAIPGISPTDMQIKLKDIITHAAESGQIDHIDWNTYELPQQHLQRERAAMLNVQGLTLANTSGNTSAHQSPLGGRKRKSSDVDTFEPEHRPVTPPWKKQNIKGDLENRITGKDKKQRKIEAFRANQPDSKSLSALERRRQRFGHVSPESPPYTSRDDTPAENPNGPVVGTCQKLEKNYFRLTSAPKPEEVRPLPVLEEMYKVLLEKWRKDHNYAWTCDQLKSMRQDLTVQHIKHPFTVKVYEAHARIALEMADLGEYNQCQTQLRALHKLNLGGKPEEFMAYRILYFIYTCNRTGMNDVLADLTEADKRMEGVAHALKVRAALALGNYHKFFRLYQETPFMGAYLLDMCLPRERLAALAAICKSYKPDVSLDFLVKALAFHDTDESDPEHGYRACVQFICDHGGDSLIQRREDGEVRFLAGQARNIFEAAKQGAFRRVDIKGQI